MKNKPYALLLAAFFAAAFAGCSGKEDVPEQKEMKTYAKSNRPVYISPSLEDSHLRTALQQAFPNQTGLDNAQIAFIGPTTPNSEYFGYYLDGGFIMICGVDDDTEKKLSDEFYGMPSIPEYDNDQSDDDTDNMMLYGFNNRSDEFWMPWPIEPGLHESAKKDSTDMGGEGPDESDPDSPIGAVLWSPYVKPAYDSDYILGNMDELVDWADKGEFLNTEVPATRSDDTGGEALKLNPMAQRFRFTYPIYLNEEIDKTTFLEADYLEASSAITGNIEITPMYASSATSDPGDYYIVNLEITVKNGGMWRPKHVGHGMFDDRIIGYYLKSFDLSAELSDSTGERLPRVNFMQSGSPEPETNMGSSDHEDAVSKSIEVGLTVGKESGGWKGELSGTYNYTWSTAVTRSLPDLQVRLNTPENFVFYTLDVRNIVNDHHYFDNIGPEIAKHYPEICRSDMRFKCSWVWFLPSALNDKAGVKDGSRASFRMKLNLTPKYGAFNYWRCSVWDYEHEYCPNRTSPVLIDRQPNVREGMTIGDIDMPVPNRTRFGYIELTNMSTKYTLTDIRISESGTSDYKDISGAANKNKSIQITVPEGTYDIEYTFVDPNTNTKVDTYRISSIEVTQGSTQDDSTVQVPSTNGVKL